MVNQQSIALYGHCSHREFQTPYRDLLETVAPRRSLVLQLAPPPGDDNLPLLCTFLYQSYPGEFPTQFLRQLIDVAPLAPVIQILGAACQGEARTGRPYQYGFRLYSCQWNTFHRQQLQYLANGRPSLFSLPPSYGDDELILAQADFAARSNNLIAGTINQASANGNGQTPPCRCLVLSHFGPFGNDRAMNLYLAELYTRQGFQVEIGLPRATDLSRPALDLILVDADDSPFSEILKAIQRLSTRLADTDISVCINSPRINEIAALQNIGVRTVFSKP